MNCGPSSNISSPHKSGNFESCFLLLQALVWDNALTGPFGLIAEYSLLKVSHTQVVPEAQWNWCRA